MSIIPILAFKFTEFEENNRLQRTPTYHSINLKWTIGQECMWRAQRAIRRAGITLGVWDVCIGKCSQNAISFYLSKHGNGYGYGNTHIKKIYIFKNTWAKWFKINEKHTKL